MNDWEKYASREYEDLIADEELNKQYEYEDDFEDEDEELELGGGNVAKSAVETYANWPCTMANVHSHVYNVYIQYWVHGWVYIWFRF